MSRLPTWSALKCSGDAVAFPHASIFDVEHEAGNSPWARGISRYSCQKAQRHNVNSNSPIYMFTQRERVSVFACVCNTIVHCHLQSNPPHPPPHTHTNTQIPTDQNHALHQIQRKACLLMIWCDDNRRLEWDIKGEGYRERRREVTGESGRGSGGEIGEWPTAGAFIISYCSIVGARWDNCPLTLNTQHAFLMSTNCCQFNI